MYISLLSPRDIMTIEQKEIIDFGLISFDIEQVDEIVEKVGLKFNKNDYLIDDNKIIKCKCCGHPIKKRNLGNILPGSKIIYCDNPTCFAEYMDDYLGL